MKCPRCKHLGAYIGFQMNIECMNVYCINYSQAWYEDNKPKNDGLHLGDLGYHDKYNSRYMVANVINGTIYDYTTSRYPTAKEAIEAYKNGEISYSEFWVGLPLDHKEAPEGKLPPGTYNWTKVDS